MFFDGTLCDGEEQWSTSLAFTSNTGAQPDSGPLSAWCNAVMDALAGAGAGATRLRQWLSNTGTIERVRVYSYPTVGAPADVAGESVRGNINGELEPDLPPQCALVISLLTGVPGKSFRGRMYWPRIAGGVTDTGRDATVGITPTNNVAAFIGGIGTLNTGDVGDAAVVSATKLLVTPVTQISIGDVIDTQRRRRDSLIENRNFANI